MGRSSSTRCHDCGELGTHSPPCIVLACSSRRKTQNVMRDRDGRLLLTDSAPAGESGQLATLWARRCALRRDRRRTPRHAPVGYLQFRVLLYRL
jgi:hypothetical protein